MHGLEIDIGRYSVLPFIVLGLVVFSLKLRNHPHHSMIANFLIGTMATAVAAVLALPKPGMWWFHIVGNTSMHYGVLFFYFGIDQMLNEKLQRPIISSNIFIITTVLTIVTTVLDSIRRDNLNTIIDNIAYQPTWDYYTSEFIHYFIILYLSISIVILYIQSIRINKSNLIYTIRRYVCLLAFIMATATVTVVDINVILAIWFGDTFRAQLNHVYHIGKPLIFFLVALGFVLPQRLFAWLLRPVVLAAARYIQHRQRHHQALLAYLHDHIVQIVPCVHLHNEHIRHLRTHTEIGDARELIWSHRQSSEPITPKVEATYLLALLREGAVIGQPGAYTSPIPRNLVAYNLAVAKHLKRLEKRPPKAWFKRA